MKTEQAIDIISNEIKCVQSTNCLREECSKCDLVMQTNEILEALNMAIEALQKRIPMKMPGTYTNYKCAVCGRRIRSGKGSSSYKSRDYYCQKCGQMIDWGEE